MLVLILAYRIRSSIYNYGYEKILSNGQSAAPTELNMMFTNVENNGAPWQFSAS